MELLLTFQTNSVTQVPLMSSNESHPSPELELPEYRESHIRTFLKTLSWRVVATTTTVVIAYFVFGDVSSALTVGGIEFFAKMAIYYVHERIWQLAPRGSIRSIVHK